MSISLESLVQEPAADARGVAVGKQLVIFICIGASAAGGYLVLSNALIGLHLGIDNWLVSALCYGAFILPVYLAHRHFSFQSDAPHGRALPRYVAVQLCGLGLATLFSYLAYRLLALPTLSASVIVIGLTAGINFMVLRLWAFARSR
jgi:putative flippase GtrA